MAAIQLVMDNRSNQLDAHLEQELQYLNNNYIHINELLLIQSLTDNSVNL